ncbi:MAG TPA: hypothetical protein VGQ08_02220 [Nitrospiraceae bacterium]|jgi:hypothetical protein|nr:hypothetical protein [Nitrospiraceae bacterium]
MALQLLKPAGLCLMTSQTETAVKRKGKIPWYVYFVGGILYTVLAVMLFTEVTLPVLAWICAISAPLGFYYAWGAWKQDKRNRVDA